MESQADKSVLPKVTVVTCTYKVNKEFLKNALLSVETQTYPNIEHIFNDSYSDDETLKIINDYIERNKDRYEIKFFQSEPKGVANALNVAYKHATGDIINFLHSDDYYVNPTALERAVSYFKDGVTWVTGDTILEYKGTRVKVPVGKVLKLNPKRVITTITLISHENTFMKTYLLDKYGGFNEKVKSPVEYRLWLRMVGVEPVNIVDDTFTVFIINNGSVSTGSFKALLNALRECAKVLKEEEVIPIIGLYKELTLYKKVVPIVDKVRKYSNLKIN